MWRPGQRDRAVLLFPGDGQSVPLRPRWEPADVVGGMYVSVEGSSWEGAEGVGSPGWGFNTKEEKQPRNDDGQTPGFSAVRPPGQGALPRPSRSLPRASPRAPWGGLALPAADGFPRLGPAPQPTPPAHSACLLPSERASSCSRPQRVPGAEDVFTTVRGPGGVRGAGALFVKWSTFSVFPCTECQCGKGGFSYFQYFIRSRI